MKTRQKKLSQAEQKLADDLIYERWEAETIEKGRQQGRQEEQQLMSRIVSVLLQVGLSVDQIAQQLQIDVETVMQAAQS